MRVIIIGAGNIGYNIADFLQKEGHDLVVIDENEQKIADIEDSLDVFTIRGNGCDVAILNKAEADKAELILALTNNDEANLIAAFTAKRLGTHKAVARVRSHSYLNTAGFDYHHALGIDLILSPELLTAIEIVKFLDHPNALALAHYARGRIELRQLLIDNKSPYIKSALKDLHLPEGVLIICIAREKELIIPKGCDILQANDRITLLGEADKIQKIQRQFTEPVHTIRDVVIAGGGETGLAIARALEKRYYHVHLIDARQDRCHYLSELLDKTEVIYGDVTQASCLKEEKVDSADMFIAVTGDDETNIMSSLLAKELGTKQCVIKVNRPDYARVMQRVGIDLALSPRIITVNQVLALIRRETIKSVYIIEEGELEVIEFRALDNSPVINKPLKHIPFPGGCLVGSIFHQGRVKVPHGEDMILPGDTVIVIGRPEVSQTLEKLFKAE